MKKQDPCSNKTHKAGRQILPPHHYFHPKKRFFQVQNRLCFCCVLQLLQIGSDKRSERVATRSDDELRHQLHRQRCSEVLAGTGKSVRTPRFWTTNCFMQLGWIGDRNARPTVAQIRTYAHKKHSKLVREAERKRCFGTHQIHFFSTSLHSGTRSRDAERVCRFYLEPVRNIFVGMRHMEYETTTEEENKLEDTINCTRKADGLTWEDDARRCFTFTGVCLRWRASMRS